MADFERWDVVRELLPEGWDELARATGAFTRARGVADASALLRVIMLHAATGLSLVEASAQARLSGLSKLGSVSLHHRLMKSEPWLRQLCGKLLEEQAGQLPLDGRRRWRVIDASLIHEKGETGSVWRVHYSLELPSMRCDHFELTSEKRGESLRYWKVRPGEVLLVDRGYSHRGAVAEVIQSGAEVVMRWTSASFPLNDQAGRPLDLRAWLKRSPKTKAFERVVTFEHQGVRHTARLCGLRKSRAATQQSVSKMRDKNRGRAFTLSDNAIYNAGFILVLTTLPAEEYTAAQILEIYRCRWQVELAFKRLKTLLKLGHLPKGHPQTAQAWLLAKLLAALLIEKTLRQAQLFSPWGYPLPAA